jgi:hypothetical protein
VHTAKLKLLSNLSLAAFLLNLRRAIPELYRPSALLCMNRVLVSDISQRNFYSWLERLFSSIWRERDLV